MEGKESCRKSVTQSIRMGLTLMAFNSSCLWAEGLSSVTESSLKDSIGNVIMLVAGVVGPVVLAIGLLVGGIKYHNGDEEALSYIKGGIVGGLLSFGAWGISKWLFASF